MHTQSILKLLAQSVLKIPRTKYIENGHAKYTEMITLRISIRNFKNQPMMHELICCGCIYYTHRMNFATHGASYHKSCTYI